MQFTYVIFSHLRTTQPIILIYNTNVDANASNIAIKVTNTVGGMSHTKCYKAKIHILIKLIE